MSQPYPLTPRFPTNNHGPHPYFLNCTEKLHPPPPTHTHTHTFMNNNKKSYNLSYWSSLKIPLLKDSKMMPLKVWCMCLVCAGGSVWSPSIDACCCCWAVWGRRFLGSGPDGPPPAPAGTGRCWPPRRCGAVCWWGRWRCRGPFQTRGWPRWRCCPPASAGHASWTAGSERGRLNQAVGAGAEKEDTNNLVKLICGRSQVWY